MVHLLRFGVFLSSIAASLAQQVPLLSENGHRLVHKLEAKTKSDLLDLHRNLIEIDSITGNEKKVGEWLSSYLEEHGLTVEKQYVSDDRFNVFAYPGKSRETKILVSSHIDTVRGFSSGTAVSSSS
jgi:acetylornithine deacetylase